jgi:heptosyltransferase-2
MKILFLQEMSAGDVVMTTGTIKGLKEKYPDSQIDYMTSKQYMDILEGNNDVNKIIQWGTAINQKDYDMILYPHSRIRNAAFGRQDIHLADIYARMCGVERRGLYINPKEPDVSILKKLPENYITIHTTSQEIKNYDRFNEVASLLSKETGIVQIGGKDDSIISINSIINLCGLLTFRETAYIVKQSKLHLGIDSSCGHIASAVKKLSVTIFGGTGARVCKPVCNNIAIEPDYLRHCLILAPCYGTPPWPCGNKCINTIEPSYIADVVRENIKH